MILLYLIAVVLMVTERGKSISFDPASYLEVYPDPRDPEVLKGRTPLYFANIVSFGGGFDSSGTVAGVKVALDRINNDSSLLPGYTLHYALTDCQCTETQGLNSFFSEILREPVKLAVLGAGCSISTEVTAAVSYFYNVTQISCTSSSAKLRDRSKFPYYFQLLSSADFVAYAYYEAIREYQWKKVALLVQNEGLFTATTDTLKTLLDNDNIEYNEKIFDTKKGIVGLGSNPFEDGYRIFYLSMYEIHARELLCMAYSQGIIFPEYTLLSPAWYSPKWWRAEGDSLACSVEDREQVILSSLAFVSTVFLNAIIDTNVTSATGITGGEFLAAEQKYLEEPPLNLTFLEYSQYCYDATWTLAYALNRTLNSIRKISSMSAPISLEDFTYSDSRLLHLMFQHLNQTKFDGITGPVTFDEDGIRGLSNITVYQYRAMTTDDGVDVNLVQIGDVVPPSRDIISYTFEYVNNENIDTVWQGLLPFDGIPRENDVTVHLAITVLVVTLAFFGVAFAVICLIFNFVFRETKLVKLTSSNLNYLIGIGAIILYVDTVFHVIPSTNPKVVTVFCNLTPWLTAIGYSLCYGTILAKMARVFYIFNNPSTSKKKITDLILAIAIALMVAVDVSIITIYTVVERLNGSLNATRVAHGENPSITKGEQRIITEFFIYICNSTAYKIFLGILYGYKMLLQAISLLFAFSIRKVKVKGLNDAKFIGASIYVTSIVLAVVIVATYSLRDFINAFAALFCTGFLFGTTVILLLVFVPLMVGLYKDPKGENIFKTSSTMSTTISSAEADVVTLKQRIKQLEDEVKEIEKTHEMDAMRQRIKELEDKIKLKEEGNTKELPDPTESAIHRSLEGSRMIKKKKRVVVGGTIWDDPKERQQQHIDNAAHYKKLQRYEEN